MIAPKPGAGYHARSVVAITERNSLGWPVGAKFARNAESARPSVVLTMRSNARRSPHYLRRRTGMTSAMTGLKPGGQFVMHSW